MASPIVEQKSDSTFEQILDKILPKKTDVKDYYSLSEIEECLNRVRDENELRQRDANDKFDATLAPNMEEILNLSKIFHDMQLAIMKFQCDITFAQEHCKNLKSICDNPVVRERRELVNNEKSLLQSMYKLKYDPLKDFFDKLIAQLHNLVGKYQSQYSKSNFNSTQLFDWGQFHQAIFLLRTCGKGLIDVNRFEQMYQNKVDLVNFIFKVDINKLDFSQFFDQNSIYSIETLLEITTSDYKRVGAKEFMSKPEIEKLIQSKLTDQSNYTVFDSVRQELLKITKVCCEQLVNLNVNYIEAHLTDGINIDRLNNCEDGKQVQVDEPTKPLYAFSPQEYVTQIAQHLLTLRKQAEQYDNSECDSQSLMLALESYVSDGFRLCDSNSDTTIARTILKCIARLCVRSLLGRTSHSVISRLTENGRRQLATDALYLDNVLEDLGLLKATDENYDRFKALLMQ